ncbi:hypothetical protein Mgra_00006642 [Meloidogyne graminicola]|uniref:Uncharacterized protein n=1 Tax=Meloidogyne graminicola TaxID=189291 RepID=A0A8S9ZLA1_9BILA|nr:hypothetical protein Mgra_00006642 [Meloidogyne graminicola]
MISIGYTDKYEPKYEALPPKLHDMMLPDVNNELFRNIGIREEKEHLSKGEFSSPYFPVVGTIYGPNNRLFICLTCRDFDDHDAPVVNVWFVVDSGSGSTFINEKTMKALAGSDKIYGYMRIAIQDPHFNLECWESHSHFKDANVLGMDDLNKLKVTIEGMNWKNKSFRLARH